MAKEKTVTIFNFVKLLGGLAFFLFGMSLLSGSLEKMAGGKLEKLLKKVTDNPLKGFLVGSIITIAIQSSSATTVMLVGFVNSGIMELSLALSSVLTSAPLLPHGSSPWPELMTMGISSLECFSPRTSPWSSHSLEFFFS